MDANDPKLTAYVLGELNEQQRAEVEVELQSNPQLRDAVDQLRKTSDLLFEALTAGPAPALREDQRAEIERAVSPAVSKQPAAHAEPSGNKAYLWGALAVVAALMLLALFGFPALLNSGNPVAVVDYDSSNPDEGVNSPRDEGRAYTNSEVSEPSGLSPAGDPQASQPDPGLFRSVTDDSLTLGPMEPAAPGKVVAGPEENESGARLRSRPNRSKDGYSSRPPSGQSASSERGSPESPPQFTPTAPADPRNPVPPGTDPPADNQPQATDLPTVAGIALPSSRPEPVDRSRPDDAPGETDPAKGPSFDDRKGSSGGEARGESDTPEATDMESTVDELRALDSKLEQVTDTLLDTRRAGEAQPGSRASGGKEDASKEDSKKGGESSGRSARTWQPSQAVPNASRLMVGDKDELPLKGMQVNVVVDGFRARVLLDCYYYNDRNRQLEGSFKLRLPNDASLYYVAFGQTSFEYRPMVDELASRGFLPEELVRSSGTGLDGIRKARSDSWSKVKEARMVPRQKAALAYSETVRRRVDPALVEWSGAGVFQAKVFPLMPKKLHRVVIGYDVNLQRQGPDLVYQLSLPRNVPECTVDIDVSATPGLQAEVTPGDRPFLSSGRAFYHFEQPKENIQVKLHQPGTILLGGGDDQTGEYFATRFTPDLPKGEATSGAERAVFLVDTSLSSNPDKFHVWLDLMEETLTANRESMKRFAVLFFNVETHWWKEKFVDNTPKNVTALMRHCQTLSLEGATDLRSALTEVTTPSWPESTERAKNPDLFLMSDGAVTWGEANAHMLVEAVRGGSGGTVFGYKTGLTGTSNETLEHLARETGGAVFSVTSGQEVAAAATAHRQRPWQFLTATVTGGSDLLIAGRPRSIYPGQSLLLVGRGSPPGIGRVAGQSKITLKVRRGDEVIDVDVPVHSVVPSQLTPRLYGQVAVGQLEELQHDSEKMAVAYARHFRVTGASCSLLMLDSEADYQRFNIRPEDDVFVVKSSPVKPLITRKLDELASKLGDPKRNTLAWLEKLQRTDGFQFQVPVALENALEQMPVDAFKVQLPRLECKQRAREDLPKAYFQQLEATELDYAAITTEAERRREAYGNADALKVLSNLVERNPGDPVLAQDVAFSAIQWGYGGQAYPLLRRVAEARPYQPHVYTALAQCLAELGNADLAMIHYEVALNGRWNARYQDVQEIAAMQYVQMLRHVVSGELKTTAPAYARARLESLTRDAHRQSKLVVVMSWNTDRTDVDLHVREPSGEECFYKNRNTRAGGHVTRDVTQGFGPEMYSLGEAKSGRYTVLANYYGTDANRTGSRTKVFVTIYAHLGTPKERIERHAVLLSQGKQKREVASIVISP